MVRPPAYSRAAFTAATDGATGIASSAESSNIVSMDAPNPSATPTFASRTPLHIGAIGLKVRDLARLTGFYREVLGLVVLEHGNDRATLGAGGVPLVELEHQPDAKPDDPRTAGLYH